MVLRTGSLLEEPTLPKYLASKHTGALQHTATHTNAPYHTTTHSTKNQRSLTVWLCTLPNFMALHHTATPWNPLQRTATHLNALQHCAPNMVHFLPCFISSIRIFKSDLNKKTRCCGFHFQKRPLACEGVYSLLAPYTKTGPCGRGLQQGSPG